MLVRFGLHRVYVCLWADWCCVEIWTQFEFACLVGCFAFWFVGVEDAPLVLFVIWMVVLCVLVVCGFCL